jgi:trehalose 6-phosphate phosphatase
LLERFKDARARAGIFLDFDGTLSEIVPRPQLAKASPGTAIVLSRLATRYAVVGLISGRPAEEARRLVSVPGIEVFGVYGLSEADSGSPVAGVRDDVEAAARNVRGAWMEDKKVSVAVHYRAAEDVDAAGAVLSGALGAIADRHGLSVMPGKMVIELVPPDTGKGSVIESQWKSRNLSACLYAGDDVADLQAFAALDHLREEGVLTVKVAVRTAETPAALVAAADIVADRPAGLVELLSDL